MHSAVMSRHGTLQLPYCPPGPADVLPPLWVPSLPRARRVYPYALQELTGKDFIPRTLQALELENDFLKLTFLPELGGRLNSIYDKTSNQELLFTNSVLKPVMAGLTGAWCGTGMEFNFPGSHSVTSDRPVFCRIAPTAPDGSAAVTICDRELVSGMRWQVTVRLQPDSEVVFISATCQNCTPLPHPAYWWTNAKVPAFQDTELIFPTCCQGGAIHPPMDITRIATWKLPCLKGIDLSKYANVYFQLPLFFQSLRQNTFGIYHRKQDCGLIHHADYGTLPGRKIWTLGNGDDGQVTNENLTVDGARNVELQTGMLPLQTDFTLLNPGEKRTWEESWLPVRHMLAKHLASSPLFTASTDEHGTVRLQCHAQIQNLQWTCSDASTPLNATAGDCIDLPAQGEWKITTSDGWSVFESPQPHEEPADTSTPIRLDTAEAQYLQGLYCEENGQHLQAQTHYRNSLTLDSSYVPALLSRARHHLLWRQPAEALPLLQQAWRKNRRLAEVAYYLGLCHVQMGSDRKAIFYFQRARTSQTWRAASDARLAELHFKNRRLTELLQLLAADGADDNPELQEIAALLAYCRNTDMSSPLARLRELTPENPLPDLLEKRTPQTPDLRSVLLTLQHLRQLGMNDLASDRASTWQDQDPTAAYLAGNIALAESMDVTGVFPPTGLLDTFEDLMKTYPDASKCHYYAGVLRAAREDWEGAAQAWERAFSLGLHTPSLLRNLGLYHWHVTHNTEQALICYQRGFSPQTATYKYVREMDELMEECNLTHRRRKLFEQLPETLATNPYVVIRRAAFKLADRRPAEAIAELQGHRFVLCEGKRLSSALFIEANLQLGQQKLAKGNFPKALDFFHQALSYPHDLGTGRSAGMFDMKTKFLILKTLMLQGKRTLAQKRRQEWLDECDRLNIDFLPLTTIRWEAGTTSRDDLLNENAHYYNMIKEQSYEA